MFFPVFRSSASVQKVEAKFLLMACQICNWSMSMNTWPTGTLAFFPVLWKQNSGKFFPMLASLETARVCNYHWYGTFMLFLAVYIFFFFNAPHDPFVRHYSHLLSCIQIYCKKRKKGFLLIGACNRSRNAL